MARLKYGYVSIWKCGVEVVRFWPVQWERRWVNEKWANVYDHSDLVVRLANKVEVFMGGIMYILEEAGDYQARADPAGITTSFEFDQEDADNKLKKFIWACFPLLPLPDEP